MKTLIKFIVAAAMLSTTLAVDFKLEWDPNTEVDLAGYNVYRGDAQNTLEHIASIECPPNDATCATYTDTDLTVGLKYYYAVTAENISGLESGFSNIVEAFEPNPTPPSTPGNLRYTITTQAINLEWDGEAQFYTVLLHNRLFWVSRGITSENSVSLPLRDRESLVVVSAYDDGYVGSDYIYIR